MKRLLSVMFLLAILIGVFSTRDMRLSDIFRDPSAWFSSYAGKRALAPSVAGAEVLRHEEPVSFESRARATQFVPVRRENASDLRVPSAHAAAIVDEETGVLLYGQNDDEHRQIASLTKMMTAILAVERIDDLDEPVIVDEEAVYAEGTRVGCPRSGYCIGNRLKVGERVRVRDLLKAALMNSANDAAIALGKHMGGTQDGFAKIMNDRARELGLKNTHFCTPSGLEPDGRESECYSSAADIARIAAWALQYDILWDIMRLPGGTTITSVDKSQSHDILNTDAILGQFPGLIGTKTGFTPLAGYSLLAAASDPTGRHRVVAVVLDDPFRWDDIQTMFTWTFQSYEWK